MTGEQSDQSDIIRRRGAGHVTVNDIQFSYVECDGIFDVWSTNDDVSVPDLTAASRAIRALHPAKKSDIRVRTVPAPYHALGEPMTWDDLRPEFDDTLKRALLVLGVDASDEDTGACPPSIVVGWRMRGEKRRII